MFEILHIIFDTELLFYAALLAISSFLLAEFKMKELNTKLIVCAVLMIIYVICSIILNFVVPWSNAYDVLFLVGGFAISVFVGFAIDTVLRLTKKKSLIIILSFVLALIIGLLAWWIMPKSLCKTDVEKVEKITIFSGHVGKEIQITDEEEITELMEKFSSVKMKVKKISGISMGYMYNVTIETNFGKKEFTVNSKYDIDGKVWLYKVIDGDNGYDYIDNMFQKFYD